MKTNFNVENIRKDFPILSKNIYGKPLVYLDNAATTQKPQCVIESLQNYYLNENANIHRGVHFLSEVATKKYDQARIAIKNFINAEHDHEIIFVRGATEGINLVASSFGKKFISEGDEVIISGLEHHSNIVPWQMICKEKKATLKVIPIDDEGNLLLNEFNNMLSSKTKIVALTHVSNALGTVNQIEEIIADAHKKNIPVLIDGAQSIPHFKIDVRKLNADFFVFSSHKLFGPTGIGVLYGKTKFLEDMPPYQSGGDMIRSVTFEETIFNTLPYKFEAGTPNIEAVIGMHTAINYLDNMDWFQVENYEQELLNYAEENLKKINGVKIIGNAQKKAGVISFLVDDIHPHDIGTILDREGVAIRAGHHCAQPVMIRFGIPATARASFSFYNTIDEIDKLLYAIKKSKEIFNNV